MSNNNNNNNNNNKKSFYLTNKDKFISEVSIRTIYSFILNELGYCAKLTNNKEEIRSMQNGIKQVKEHREKLFEIIEKAKTCIHSRAHDLFGIKKCKYDSSRKISTFTDFPIKYSVERMDRAFPDDAILGKSEIMKIFEIMDKSISMVIENIENIEDSLNITITDNEIIESLNNMPRMCTRAFEICSSIKGRVNDNKKKSFYSENKNKNASQVSIRIMYDFILNEMNYCLRLTDNEKEIELINTGIKQVKEHREKLFEIIEKAKTYPRSGAYLVLLDTKWDENGSPKIICGCTDYPMSIDTGSPFYLGEKIILGKSEISIIINHINYILDDYSDTIECLYNDDIRGTNSIYDDYDDFDHNISNSLVNMPRVCEDVSTTCSAIKKRFYKN